MGKPRSQTTFSDDDALFKELALSWSSATAHLSSPAKLVEHPAYRQIIGLGPAVLPLMLQDLAPTHRFWFPALNAITGENPVPDDAAGDVERSNGAAQIA